MALYPWRCPCGNEDETYATMRNAPQLGELRPCPACGGRNTLARVVALPGVNREKQAADLKYPYVSRSHSAEALGISTVDKAGHPVVLNKASEREAAARATAFYGTRVHRE